MSDEHTELVPAGEAGLDKMIDDTASSTQRQLASEKIVVSAPLSLAGSAERIWKLTKIRSEMVYRVAIAPIAIVLIVMAWMAVVGWYVIFGLFLVPYRLVRRGQRKRKREAAMHRETLAAIERKR